MIKPHKFHIPVMGIGFTLDTPLKVSHLGIDSVVSLVDDLILEKLRKMYSEKYQIPYQEISRKVEDFRAKRITSYLNMLQSLAQNKFDELKQSALEASAEGSQKIKEYMDLLPDGSQIKNDFKAIGNKYLHVDEVSQWLKANLSMGSIDVNIMTKVDKDNFSKGEKLPVEYNDAHAALRGYAESDLESTIILSAGMNQRLFAYMEKFSDFYPNEEGYIKKKIAIKVSDYRSALIQGKLLAKRGIWVSEYRIESGLNCGGHAFATDGYLLGPVLDEFKVKRNELSTTLNEIVMQALMQKGLSIPRQALPIKITAQGGVGTADESQFLMDYYQIDSVGWGSPFLLVEEATTVDDSTRQKLINATEEDIYLSDISPLGVPFNNLRGNTKDLEKMALIADNNPGSACPKRYVALNTEYNVQGMCTASRQYQRIKIKELENEKLSPLTFNQRFKKIVEKSCTCVGLGTSALLAHNLDTKVEGPGVSVCPGPNMAYFSKLMSMKQMIDHIYGRDNVIVRNDRPNMFIKELKIYVDYLKDKLEKSKEDVSNKQKKYLMTFSNNLKEGINYYNQLFTDLKDNFQKEKDIILRDLELSKQKLQLISLEIEKLP
jgi:hypothetical protein